LPGFLHDLKKTDEKAPMTGRTSVNMAFIFLTVLIACAVTLLGSVYPQREYIFIVHSYLSAGGDVPFALWSFFQYSLASVLPLMVVWAGVFGAGSKARGNLKALRLYKVISAALFLGVGIGLGYFLLNYNIVQS